MQFAKGEHNDLSICHLLFSNLSLNALFCRLATRKTVRKVFAAA